MNQRPEVFSLKVEDIEGARANSLSNKFLMRDKRKNFIETNKINDIEGCSVNSFKKGIVTIRSVNPLNPTYQLPGEKEMEGDKQYEAELK